MNKNNFYKDNDMKLFMGGISWDTTPEMLRQFLQPHAQNKITDIKIPVNHMTGNSRGFGFVTFSSKQDMETIINLSKEKKLLMNERIIEAKNITPNYNKKSYYRRSGGPYNSYGRMNYRGQMYGAPPVNPYYQTPVYGQNMGGYPSQYGATQNMAYGQQQPYSQIPQAPSAAAQPYGQNYAQPRQSTAQGFSQPPVENQGYGKQPPYSQGYGHPSETGYGQESGPSSWGRVGGRQDMARNPGIGETAASRNAYAGSAKTYSGSEMPNRNGYAPGGYGPQATQHNVASKEYTPF